MKRFLRNIVDGTIYDWNERLAANPKCVEVTYEEAYPERFNVDYNKITRVYTKSLNRDNNVINVPSVTDSDNNNNNVLVEVVEQNINVINVPSVTDSDNNNNNVLVEVVEQNIDALVEVVEQNIDALVEVVEQNIDVLEK